MIDRATDLLVAIRDRVITDRSTGLAMVAVQLLIGCLFLVAAAVVFLSTVWTIWLLAGLLVSSFWAQVAVFIGLWSIIVGVAS